MDPSTTTGESGPPPPLGGEPLQTDPDPFAEMDPDIFTSGFSGQKSKEQVTGDSQSQSDNEKEISSSESDVDMRDTEKTHSTHAEAVISTDPSKVTAEPLRISELCRRNKKKIL
jgi:hypothetical protein